MRAQEFISENASAAATSAGSVAPVMQPLGGMISRVQTSRPAKYANSIGSVKKGKKHAGR
jgi:hypothetical protein